MERKIGEIFEFGGEWYQCIKSDSCRCGDCGFGELGDCDIIACASGEREDNKEVYFKKLEKVGEPYEFDGHLFQSYHTFDVPIFTENYATVRELGNNSKISIEIKQTKEDMEENHKTEDTLLLTKLISRYVNNLIDYETFEKAVKELYSDKKNSKPTLKEFDIEAAKSGKPVYTRDGRKARIICFDVNNDKPIVAVICCKEGKETYPYTFYPNGLNMDNNVFSNTDLMMLPEKKERWINVYKERCYESKEEAIRHIAPGTHYIDTIRVEWEE